MDRIKWEEVHQRLHEANLKLDREMSLSPERQKEKLKQRAQQLARTEIEIDNKEAPLEVVEFRLADETYALECIYISEVYPLRTLTPIPGTPAFVLGIINIRGKIVSVIDLKSFFDLPPKGLSDLTRVIVLKYQQMEFGILAEEVTGTTSINPSDMQPPLLTLTGIYSKYLKGIGKNRVIILDAVKLLTDEKIVINQEMEV